MITILLVTAGGLQMFIVGEQSSFQQFLKDLNWKGFTLVFLAIWICTLWLWKLSTFGSKK